MSDFAWSLRTTALGQSVVVSGFVLLFTMAVVAWLLGRAPRPKARRRAGGFEGALPATQDSTSPGTGLATEVVDGEAVAAMAACLACAIDGRFEEGAEPVGLPASLVAAIAAAIIAREEAGSDALSGQISIKVRKGALA